MNLKSCFYNNVFTILFPTTVKYDRSKKKKKKRNNPGNDEKSWDFVSILYNWWLDEWWWKTSIEYIQKLHGWHRMALQSDR